MEHKIFQRNYRYAGNSVQSVPTRRAGNAFCKLYVNRVVSHRAPPPPYIIHYQAVSPRVHTSASRDFISLWQTKQSERYGLNSKWDLIKRKPQASFLNNNVSTMLLPVHKLFTVRGFTMNNSRYPLKRVGTAVYTRCVFQYF